MKKKRKKSLFKRINAFLHLWLGLISGLVVFVVALTGCLFSFQQEINNFIHQKEYHVQVSPSEQILPISKLKSIADKHLGFPSNFITTYPNDKSRSWEFMVYKLGNVNAISFFGTVAQYKSVFINPYSGKITGSINYKSDFFTIVKYLHWSLLLNTKYGQPIVGYATLVFVLLMISGLILWWPKNTKKAALDRSFTVRWKASFKRLNYDLHNVLGFYAVFIGLILAFTGLMMSFKWFEKAVYVTANHSLKQQEFKTFASGSTQKINADPLDIAFYTAKNSMRGAKRIGLSPAVGTKGVIYISGYYGAETYYNYDQLQFDQYSGKLLYRQNYQDKNNGEKLLAMNYDIHVGAIWGLPGKILAFLVSLICTSLPVTGLIIWLGKKKKAKIKRSKVRKGLDHLQTFQ